MVALEAIGAGLPVACSDACSVARDHPEWVRLFSVDAPPPQIARLVISDVAGKGPRRAARAREGFRARYSLDALGDAWAGLLEALARKRKKPRLPLGSRGRQKAP